MKIEWTELSADGLVDGLEKGVSGAYAAFFEKRIVVAGGSNFPDKLGFEGGKKINYNQIVEYNLQEEKWEVVGELPQKSAYGVSVPFGNDFLWLGGVSNQSLSESYRVSLSENSLQVDNFSKLPNPIDNFAGCSLGSKVFIGGGMENGRPSNSLYQLDLKGDNTWRKLPDFPGIPRVQPIMVALQLKDKEYIYLFGGFFGGDTLTKPQIATEVLCYSVSDKKWEKIGEQIDPKKQTTFSLVGATAMPLNNRYILCFGGVNYDVFLKAITDLHHIANDASLSGEEKKQKNSNYLREYLTQPVEYYKFNIECRAFDTYTNIWETITTTLNVARAGVTIVYNKNEFYLVQGEIKPGVRSPITWKGVVSI